ncbi:MAG: fatty acid desaturase [Planctomycetota bacterium]
MTQPSWKQLVAAYQQPRTASAVWQLVNSVGSYLVLWGVMGWAVTVSWWLALPLAVLAGCLLVRVFIIFHDCGHGSFFASKRANDFWGLVTGVLTFTPYDHWRGKHAVHHGTTGNLDKRGVGDVWTMTVREYEASGWWRRLSYRFMRNPIVLLGVIPLLMFLVEHRVPNRRSNAREQRSVWVTTFSVVAMGAVASLLIGFLPYLILQLVILAIAGAIGVWLFYSQHQFDEAYWQRNEEWDFEEAAIRGSAFLRLPRVLQWFTGNIGYHHIHHLNSRIPNYNLQGCHDSHPAFQGVKPLTLWGSLRAFSLKLWDEASGELIRFRDLARIRNRSFA